MFVQLLTINDAFAQDETDANALFGAIFLVLLIATFLYFLPTLLAFGRGHPNRWSIFVINLVFGATVLGWLGSLLWACKAFHLSHEGNNGGDSGLNLFLTDRLRFPIMEHAPLPIDELRRLRMLLEQGAINVEEYTQMKQRLLDND